MVRLIFHGQSKKPGSKLPDNMKVMESISVLKDSNTSSKNGIIADIWKNVKENYFDEVTRLFQVRLGSTTDVQNYRVISLVENVF